MGEPKSWLRIFVYGVFVFPSVLIAFLAIAIAVVYRWEGSALVPGRGLEIPDSLEGKTVFITGSAKGIGYYAAGEFCRRGAHVIVHGTNMERTTAAASSLKSSFCSQGGQVTPMAFDLGDFDAVRKAAKEISEGFGLLYVMILNASPGGGGQGYSPSGYQIVYACEMGHYMLFTLLENRLAPDARIVFQTSNPHLQAEHNMMMFELKNAATWDFRYLPGGKESDFYYSLAKYADICFKEALTRKWASKAKVSVLNVGTVDTEIWNGLQHYIRKNKLFFWMGPPDISGRQTFESAFAPRGFEPNVVLYAAWHPKALYEKYMKTSQLRWRQYNMDWFGMPQYYQRFTWGTVHAGVGAECTVEHQERLMAWMHQKTGLPGSPP